MDEQEWQDLKDAAAHFTSSSFVAMPAYEFWLVADNGEINTYGVPDLPPKMEFLGPDRLGVVPGLAGAAAAGSASSTTRPTSPTTSRTTSATAPHGTRPWA